MGRPRAPRHVRLWIALLAAIPLLVACGDDDGSSASGSGAGSDDEPATVSDGECVGTNLEFENLETGVSGTATAALAVADSARSQYTAHAADFEIGEDDLQSWRPEVPEGQNVVSIQVTVFVNEDSPPPAPLEVGATLENGLTLDTHTFVVSHYRTDDAWQRTIDGDGVGGEMNVTAVGDILCFDIEFQDQEKRVVGTVEAPVFREGF